jgi:hypothetical protein
MRRWVPALAVLILVLALADGVVHFALDIVLFRGNFFGALGPPPGAAPPGQGGPPQMPLPLNQLFVLNLVGYIVLAALFWFVGRGAGLWSRVVDAALIVYVVVTFVAWWQFGRPNPQNLGILSKTIEVLLLLAVIAYIALVGAPSVETRERVGAASG